MERSYLRGACGLTRWEDESVYEKCGTGPCAKEVKCGVVEWVRRIA